jgi:hypothetical protein
VRAAPAHPLLGSDEPLMLAFLKPPTELNRTHLDLPGRPPPVSMPLETEGAVRYSEMSPTRFRDFWRAWSRLAAKRSSLTFPRCSIGAPISLIGVHWQHAPDALPPGGCIRRTRFPPSCCPRLRRHSSRSMYRSRRVHRRHRPFCRNPLPSLATTQTQPRRVGWGPGKCWRFRVWAFQFLLGGCFIRVMLPAIPTVLNPWVCCASLARIGSPSLCSPASTLATLQQDVLRGRLHQCRRRA